MPGNKLDGMNNLIRVSHTILFPPELSPREFKERHMVLPLNLLDNDHHQDYAVEVLKEYGQVREQGVRV